MDHRLWRFAWIAVVVVVACSDDEPGTVVDAGPDVVDDAFDGDVLADLDVADGSDSDVDDVAGDPAIDAQADLPPADIAADVDLGGPDYPPGPPQILFTVNELPAEMNGSLPYTDDGGPATDFTIAVPTWGFTFDVLADRPPGGLDPETFEVRCDGAFGTDDARAADTNLAGDFEWDDDRVRWLVPVSLALQEGRITCDARVGNLDGEVSEWSSVTVDAVAMTPELDPFDEPDVWVVAFTRDRYDVSLEIGAGDDYQVTGELVEGGDGEEDFVEDLRLLGLLGDESGADAATVEARGAVGANAVMRAWLIEETMRQVREHYGVSPFSGLPEDVDAVQIHLYLEGDPGAPDPGSFDGSYSIHGVGGDAPADEPQQFGRASSVDVFNTSSQDDGRLGYGSFTTSVARQVLAQPAGRFLLREFLPGLGTPMGELDVDAVILGEDFDPREADSGERWRYNQLTFALDLLTKALAALITHEIGHSLGLVACGAPPFGLFSGVYDPTFMETDPGCGHIDTPGLNIMQTGGSLLANPQDLAGEVRFGPLSLAYLRSRVVLVR